MLAFVISLHEIGISILLGRNENHTLPLKMWEGIRMQISTVIAAVATHRMCLSVRLLVLMEAVGPRTQVRIGLRK